MNFRIVIPSSKVLATFFTGRTYLIQETGWYGGLKNDVKRGQSLQECLNNELKMIGLMAQDEQKKNESRITPEVMNPFTANKLRN